jgi:hypothetical protein
MRIERVCWGPILMRCHSKPVEKQIKLVQILSAAWNSGNGLTYSLYGLDDQGRVWRRSLKQGRLGVLRHARGKVVAAHGP